MTNQTRMTKKLMRTMTVRQLELHLESVRLDYKENSAKPNYGDAMINRACCEKGGKMRDQINAIVLFLRELQDGRKST